MKLGRRLLVWAASLGAAGAACAQTPDENRPPAYGEPSYSQPAYDSPGYPARSPAPMPLPGEARAEKGALEPSLLPLNAPRQAIIAWLEQNVPAARGRLVYVNGAEAFWIEHQDVDPRDDMKVTATIQAENFADPDLGWRSSYEVTQFDCDGQQQFHVYQTRYPGNGLTGEPSKQEQLIKHGDFVSPTALDFAHIRIACLSVYDQIRKRTYAIQMP